MRCFRFDADVIFLRHMITRRRCQMPYADYAYFDYAAVIAVATPCSP